MMYNRGSLWNKWDLHIHTDASDGKGSCEEILKEAKSKQIKCIAVTDHHTVDNIDKMKSLASHMDISVISGVEFRTEYGKASVHMIGLFPDEYKGVKLDAEYLKENILNPLGITRTKIIQKGKESNQVGRNSDDEHFKKGMFLVQVNFKEAAKLIHEYGGLVTVHAGSKSNSIDKEMKHEGKTEKNVSIEDSLGPVKEELFKEGYIDICDITKPKDSSFYKKEFGKPSITTSDAHELSEVGTNACWIKADLTFWGLKQIIAEPERVSFEEPEIINRIRINPNKFIDSLEINRTSSANMPEKWFDNIQIPLNPGLIAIIGNKGSGKSALADIIALCADTSNQNWSFLTTEKFRMSKPYNRSKQTEATLMWNDKTRSSVKTLDMSSDETKPERVKYIPQNFLETLCTTEDGNKFESELKKIIFQYLDPSQRYGFNDIDSIITYLTKENTDSCSEIQIQIQHLNKEIIEKEAMQIASYKDKLTNELKYKQEQLNNAKLSEPKEVAKPSFEDNSEVIKVKSDIERIQSLIKDTTSSLQKYKKEQEYLTKALQDITASNERLQRVNSQIETLKTELKPLYKQNKLNIDSIFSVKYHPEIITAKENELEKCLDDINRQLDESNSESLQSKLVNAKIELEAAQQKLSAPELEYQKYLKDKQDWENLLKNIKGSPEKEGTIKNLQTKIGYIEHDLLDDLNLLKDRRNKCLGDLMSKKQKVLYTYNELFIPIVNFLHDYHEELKDYPIQFDATFAIKNFGDRLFDYISQQAAGSYYGREQGTMRVEDNIDTVDMSNNQQIIEFASLINDDLLRDKRDGQNSSRQIESQLKKGHTKQELYDFIYGMEYVIPFFQLKMNGKPLSSLSPGERGALLLLLYLFIDKDDKPLIIDQPEENLDNESVYKYLVHFIKVAKKKRQIIMVTHNPNLAVVCDADQIIQMKIDKIDGNRVSFESGSIENPKMNKVIVDILEGTYPAFHNRDCKYFDKTI